MIKVRFILAPLFLIVAACSSTEGNTGPSGLALMPRIGDDCETKDCDDGPSDDRCDEWTMDDDSEYDDCELDCPRGGPTGPIAVLFECTEVHVVSCKDLSNVVLEFEDGEHYKYDGLTGHYGTFGGGKRVIAKVWVKAGGNGSGEGPGYGERFNSDAEDCHDDDGAGGHGGDGGSGGHGGDGGSAGMGGSGGAVCDPYDYDHCKDECNDEYTSCKDDCAHDYEECKDECDHVYEGAKYDCEHDYGACKRDCDPEHPHCKDQCDYHYDRCKDESDYGYGHCKDECDYHDEHCKDDCDHDDERCKDECDDRNDDCEDECSYDDDCSDECSYDDYDGGHYCSCDPDIECPHGGKYGHIEVDFDCSEVHVSSCKEISNVVLELDGEEHRKFDDLEGHCATLGVADRVISGVWVKAGNNKSGDGPGYGERFDSDAEDCDGAGGDGGSGGAGGAVIH